MNRLMNRLKEARFLSALLAVFILQGPNRAGAERRPETIPVGAPHPSLHLSNQFTQISIYVPDALNGYYRGCRFDWSGIVFRMTALGHTFFGEWKEKRHPESNDHVCGTAEEFGMGAFGPSPPGYAETDENGTFMKIGVGEIRRTDTHDYRFWINYPVHRTGPWRTIAGRDSASFEQIVTGENGYGYYYRKTITLFPDSPGFLIRHELRNVGVKPITNNHYCHHFFMIDDWPVGPWYETKVPFAVTEATIARGKELFSIDRGAISLTRPLADKDMIFAQLAGFGTAAGDNAGEVYNTNAAAGIRFRADRGPSHYNFYATPRVVCLEPFIQLSAAPGETTSWSTRYEPFVR